MIRVRLDISEELPPPDITPVVEAPSLTRRASEEDMLAAITHMQYGPPTEPVLFVEARVPDKRTAADLVESWTLVLERLANRQEGFG